MRTSQLRQKADISIWPKHMAGLDLLRFYAFPPVIHHYRLRPQW
jgi:hypothetical protein